MGRSAKLHKRVSKKVKSTAPGGSSSSSSAPAQTQAQAAKKKATLKGKASTKGKGDGPVLGGADYVSLMMGGRKKAREEAAKLPKDDSA
ncbi:hypothetical protein BDQ12DRAFT_721386 [Crucibulum laeve]|uniref:Uncharacterized protein n=1 Tax=Crucibulum laeve TaxID=68775 RepID=A0A5C3M5U3_9AGAR|nr:hypothetical protein BDQ12DRAFT_721386 [Crucibulum laeve]